MKEFAGKYAACKVMTDAIESSAEKQICAFLDCEAFDGATIRIMPDVHAGAGAVIGLTCTLTDKVIPNVVGVDIGCGVSSVCIGRRETIDFPALDAFIRARIPCGFAIHGASEFAIDDELRSAILETCSETDQDWDRPLKSIGTLGGGNHFIEVGRDETESIWVTVHSGSRNFGLRVAAWHQRRAEDAVGKRGGLEWLEGDARSMYLRHMDAAQWFAAENRRRMLSAIWCDFFGAQPTHGSFVESVHNYIDMGDRMIRKGAISARVGERVIIPWNMRDGLIIGRGKGNPEWNQSAPHGAGRVMGRGQAKRTLQVADFEDSMRGIWTSCVGAETIDEAPMVYKPADEIRTAIGDTVEIERTVKPLYNFKAGKE